MTQKTTTLANWRTAPHNRWSFSHVDKILPTAKIAHASPSKLDTGASLDLQKLEVSGVSVSDILTQTSTDGFLVLHRGKIAAELYANLEPLARHILFSVSKSVTGTLTGILVAEGKLDPDAPVTDYVPQVKSSAYADCTVRHVLDMTVDLAFVEDYLDTKGDFARYRAATGWNPPNPLFEDTSLHEFLATIKAAQSRHGEKFTYISPNSDLLGWVLERASGKPFAQLMSEKLWQPMGAEADAFVTVDVKGGTRTAGGINTTLRDLARFGELVRNDGQANGRQIVPQSWVTDICENGSRDAWAMGSMVRIFPHGSYRAKWYKANDSAETIYAIGIHGQWIYVNPQSQVTAVKFSSQPDPVNDAQDMLTLQMFDAIARECGN